MDNAESVPYFLVGSERSGTTLLRLMLDHHPRLSFQPEFEFTVKYLAPDGSWPALDAYYRLLAVDRMFGLSNVAIDRSLSYPELVRSFLEQRRTVSAKPIAGATVHKHFDRLPSLWPDARFIHIVRDPRDVAHSCLGMGWAGNVWTGSQRWIDAETLVETLRPRIPSDRWIDVRYEDLISDAPTELARICRFMGIDWDARMLEYPSTSSYDAPDPSLLFRWRRKLSPKQVQLVESRVGDLLVRRGYEPSGLARVTPSALARIGFRLQDRWARNRFRIRLYGIPLWLSAAVARRSGLRAWHDRLLLRMHAIEQRHVK